MDRLPMRAHLGILAAALITVPAHAAQEQQSASDLPEAQSSLGCLAAAVYYEARSEQENGQRAVAQVVMNRLRHPSYPKSVCEVVFQGAQRSSGCQFTFTCDGSLARRPDVAGWNRAVEVAADALAGQDYSGVGGATHYHTKSVSPRWSRSLHRLATLGAHIFYGSRGAMASVAVPAARGGTVTDGASGATRIEHLTVATGLVGEDDQASRETGRTTVRIHRGTAPLIAY